MGAAVSTSNACDTERYFHIGLSIRISLILVVRRVMVILCVINALELAKTYPNQLKL